jgi:hypothetical protein
MYHVECTRHPRFEGGQQQQVRNQRYTPYGTQAKFNSLFGTEISLVIHVTSTSYMTFLKMHF